MAKIEIVDGETTIHIIGKDEKACNAKAKKLGLTPAKKTQTIEEKKEN